ncbi:hypothetical protein [Desulfoluna sp.]|uniref:hypothetical protein n=1 Tax=Desulfoluna sp. TaxID=2045199 RepID=UPI002604A112|nr:hypothetical protein [Desulfoluna sp.]
MKNTPVPDDGTQLLWQEMLLGAVLGSEMRVPFKGSSVSMFSSEAGWPSGDANIKIAMINHSFIG